MAEFYAMIERFKKSDNEFKNLYEKLNQQQQSCKQKVVKELSHINVQDLNDQLEKCEKDKKNYDLYLLKYSDQFAIKGYEICKDSINDNESKQKCLIFYMNNLTVFKENVINKLNSIIYKFDFNQL